MDGKEGRDESSRPKDGADNKAPTVGLIELVNILSSVRLISIVFSTLSVQILNAPGRLSDHLWPSGGHHCWVWHANSLYLLWRSAPGEL